MLHFSDASDQIVTEKINDVTLIAINRPESRNAVNRQTAEQLKQAFLNFDKDKYAHVAVLYGKGNESDVILTFLGILRCLNLKAFLNFDKDKYADVGVL